MLAANPDAYGVALDLLAGRVEVAAVVDLRPEGEESELGEAVRNAGVAVYAGHCVYEAAPSQEGRRRSGGRDRACSTCRTTPSRAGPSRSVATASP